MKSVEARSDELDEKIVALPAVSYKHEKIRTALITAILVFVIIASINQFIVLRSITESTNLAVTSQIPGLQQQLKSRDETISDYKYVLEKQAIPAIIKLSEQVKSLGGEPGEVILTAPDKGQK